MQLTQLPEGEIVGWSGNRPERHRNTVNVGYVDLNPTKPEHCESGHFYFRPALHRHTVKVDKGGCWTLMLTGPQIRFWGFYVKNKFKKANKYFLEHGHHQCGL